MAIRVNKTQGSFKAKTIYIGIDMHKLSWHITAMADNEVVMACSLSRPTYIAFKNMLHKFKDSAIRVAYEAGPGGFELYDQLTGDGIECIVVPPSLIPTESGNRVKTDKKDSFKLARLFGCDTLAIFQRRACPNGPHHPYRQWPAQNDAGRVVMAVDRQRPGHALQI